jgi:hypothetical protein
LRRPNHHDAAPETVNRRMAGNWSLAGIVSACQSSSEVAPYCLM